MVVKDYAMELKARGHDIAVMLYETDSSWPYEKIVRDAGIPIFRVGFNPTYNVFLRIIRKIFGKQIIRRRAIRFIKTFKPDVIHTHLDLITVICKIRHKLEGIKLVYTCHSEPEKNFGENELEAARKLCAENRLTVIALHMTMAEKIKALLFTDNVIILNNPVDVDRFKQTEKQNSEVKKKIGIPENAYVVGHVGRFVPLKNHEFLVKVFNEAIKKKPEAFLLMIGNGEKEELKKTENLLCSLELRDKCLILKDRTDMPELYSAMDVFVFPSRYEGFSIALLEAQSADLKCVVSDTVSSESYLTKKIVALPLSAPVKTWANAVISDDVVFAEPCGNLSDYDIDNVIKKLLDIYKA